VRSSNVPAPEKRRCNRWKGSLFPVADEPRRLPPRPDVEEMSLLLDPYGDKDPADHLRFDGQGFVEAQGESRVGFETIRTLGLYREPLRDARRQVARKARSLAQDLSKSPDSERIVEDLLELGDAEYAHAGW
jgi:hypothetical protein